MPNRQPCDAWVCTPCPRGVYSWLAVSLQHAIELPSVTIDAAQARQVVLVTGINGDQLAAVNLAEVILTTRYCACA
jgi:hypothetical protein